jgi:hypothetical protein
MMLVAAATLLVVASRAPISVAFSPAGLLFPYYVGAGYELRRLGVIAPSTPLGGGSAGAIIATLLACDVPEEEVVEGLSSLLEEVRSGVRLNVALRNVLRSRLDDRSHRVAEEHGLKIGYFEVLPRPGRRLVTSWESREDLIQCVGASCNWPLFYSRWPFVVCRRSWALDGWFAVGASRFGCPPLESEREIGVCALPKVKLSAFAAEDTIQPDGAGVGLPVPLSSWFSMTTNPPPAEMVEEIVNAGREDARAWHREHALN